MPKTSKTKTNDFKFKGKVIVWSYGYDKTDYESAWRFVRIPEKISAKIIKMQKDKKRRGWGAIYAKANIGKSIWTTSIFPDWHSPTYILPLKKQIRHKENLYDEKTINIQISIWF